MNLEQSFIDQSLSAADDNTWANRIILNCAKITQFCFGQDEAQVHSYEELEEYDRKWRESRPVSFLPISHHPPDPSRGEVFPEIIYLNHAVGESKIPENRPLDAHLQQLLVFYMGSLGAFS